MSKYLNNLIRSHEKLLQDYAELKRKFQGLPDNVLEQLLGEYYKDFAETIKEFGDGYSLRHLPIDTKIWKNPDLIVAIIIWSFPNLDAKSCFDPYSLITQSRYWVDTKGLSDSVNILGKEYKVKFLVYELDTGVHGRKLSRARKNEKILNSCGINFEQTKKDIIGFLSDLLNFYTSRNRRVVIFTNVIKKKFDIEIQKLLKHPGSRHFKVRLLGKNKTLMNRIQDEVISWRNNFPLIYERSGWLLNLINNVEKLKRDPEHKERAHEFLVETFYELLGFAKYVEIKYRQGRIDISIEYKNKLLIVNEVKKDWSLSWRDKKALLQAYNYALETGTPFVVLTNGDYYAIFDRRKGHSYESQFVGDFKLTKLKIEDLEIIENLKKENISFG